MIRRLAACLRCVFATPRLHAALFILFALPLGVTLVSLVPLGQVPDESAHSMRATSLWGGALIGHRESVATGDGSHLPRGGVIADISIFITAGAEMAPEGAQAGGKVTQATLLAARAMHWQSPPLFVSIGPIAGYLPVFYLPASVAILAGKLMGFGPYNAAIAGRLANLGCYLVLGAMALLLARRGRTLLLAALLLPISLFLAASLSQDGVMLGASCLAAALATRSWEVSDSRRSRLAAFVLILAIVVTKPPYLPLAALLLPPFPGSGGWRDAAPSLLRRCGLVAVVIIAAIGWLAWASHDVTAPFWRYASEAGLHEPGPLWPGPRPANIQAVDQAAQLTVLLHRPSLMLTLPVLTLIDDVWRWRETIGVLGLLNVVLPSGFYRLWIIALAASLAADLTGPRGIAERRGRWLEPLLLLGACLAAVLAIYLSQYLAWTPVGAVRIEGPQGRYLTPLIPLVAMALPRFAVPFGRTIRLGGALILALAAAVGAFVIPATIVAFYYLGP